MPLNLLRFPVTRRLQRNSFTMTGGYLPEIYRMTPTDDTRFNATEEPSDEITVKILLTKSVSSVLTNLDLKGQLTNDGMKASRYGNRNAIQVKGIRPDNSYGPQNILTVVQNFDRGARIIP